MQAIRADRTTLIQIQSERRLNMTKQRQDELTQRKRYTRKVLHDWIVENHLVIAVVAALAAGALIGIRG